MENTDVLKSIDLLGCDGGFSLVTSNIAENIKLHYEEAVKLDAQCKFPLKNLHYFLKVRKRHFLQQ